ncbi:leucine-rich repeat-containing protein 71 [Aplochiton taeniatus]
MWWVVKPCLLSIDDYQCTGSLEVDFPELCALLGVREIPAVTPRTPTVVSSLDRGNQDDSLSGVIPATTWCPKPRLQVELESDDPRSVKEVRVSGWKVDELMARVLNKTLPSLSNLQSLHLWRADLSDRTLTSLKNTIFLCTNLRTVILEGNPLLEQSYHLLISEESLLTHISLRNNQMGDEGARLIGSALSTAISANKNLLSLNLAFNCIGDVGATHIAQGLRFNRTLLCLSLANNHVGDSGAACLAQVLVPFNLTHEEILERRKLLLSRDQSPSLAISAERPLSIPSSTSLERNVSKGAKSASKKKDTPKKEEKPATGQAGGAAVKKEDPKLAKKPSDTKLQRGKVGKSGGKDKKPPTLEQEEKTSSPNKLLESTEIGSPLLDPGVQHKDGQVILPGNTAVTSLNLAGNRITEQSLPLFLASLGLQTEGGGLLRLCLARNCFSIDCDAFLKIQELCTLRDPLNKSAPGQAEEEQGQAA